MSKGFSLPKALSFGYRTYEITPMDEDMASAAEAIGLHFLTRNRIYIQQHQPEHEQVQTLLHELGHAIWSYFALPRDRDMEERVVECFATGFCQLIRENPGFAAWLGAALED